MVVRAMAGRAGRTLLPCLAAAAAAAAGTASPRERVSQSPDCLVVGNVHSAWGAVRSIGVLDTRLHLYVYVPRDTGSFTLGIYDQPDDVPGAKPSSFVLHAPDGSEAQRLERPTAGSWADYPVRTGGRWGIWRLTVTGPEDRTGEDGKALPGAPAARNAFMVRTVGEVDLYLKPEPVARVRGLRLGAPRFGGGAQRFTLQVPGGERLRINLLYLATGDVAPVRLEPPRGVTAHQEQAPLVRDDRLKKGLGFLALDATGPDLRGLWTLALGELSGAEECGFGTDGEFRAFFTDAPRMPLPVATPITTGGAAAPLEVTSSQSAEGAHVTTDAWGRGTLYLLPGFAYRVRATRGLEFGAAEASVRAGEEVRLAPARRLGRLPGWYAGDTHVHTAYYDGTHTPRQMVEAARAAGLDWLVATEHAHSPVTERVDRVIAETGPLSEAGKFVVLPGMEYTSGTFHANVFGGVVRVPAGSALTEVVRAVREQDREAAPVTVALNHPSLGKTAADLARRGGDMPLIELWNSPEPAATHLWWELLNRGTRVFAETGSDSHHRVHAEPGFRRTYVYLGDAPLTGANVVRALREGRSFMSRGALLDLHVNGARPGGRVPRGRLSLQIALESPTPLTHLEVVRSGDVVRRVELEGRRRYTGTLSLPETDGWVLAQVYAQGDRLPVALTNPVFAGGPAAQP